MTIHIINIHSGTKYIRNEVDKTVNINQLNISHDKNHFLLIIRENVEEICMENGYKYRWNDDNSLYYEYYRPII